MRNQLNEGMKGFFLIVISVTKRERERRRIEKKEMNEKRREKKEMNPFSSL